MLAYFQTQLRELSQLQTQWKSQLDPLLSLPLTNGIFVSAVLKNGVNTVNHRLGRKQQGWIITDQDAAAEIYRSQPFNNLTLTLTSNADVTVTLYVF